MKTKKRIAKQKEYGKGMNNRPSKKDRTRIRRIKKRKKLMKDNARYRNELKQKRKELNE